jgi:DNA gyrase subunit A
LEEKDDLVSVAMTDGKKQILLATKNGLACRFEEEDARSIGRTGKGVRGIRLNDKDEVIGMILVDENTRVLTLTSKGYGKQTDASEYRLINRGGKGVRNINLTEKTGHVVAIRDVTGNEDLMLVSKQGMIIRISLKDLSVIGRNTQGVRIIKQKKAMD